MGLDPLTTGLVGAGVSGLTNLFSGDPGSAASDKAGSNYDTMSAAAKKLLGEGTFKEALGESPDLTGFGAALPQLTNIYAQLMGLPNISQLSQTGATFDADPYKLNWHQQGLLNQEADTINAERNRAKNDILAEMVRSGMVDPSMTQSLLLQVDEQYDTALAHKQYQASKDAAAKKEEGTKDLMTMLTALYGAQKGEKSDAINQILQASGLLGSAASGYQGQYVAANQNAFDMSDIGTILGMIMGSKGKEK